jgi:pimeloyl-ACP methyl ester carboxylesterase
MTTLVLLHGAWHGAWCWEAFERAAGDRDLRTVAVDLPAGEADAGAARYADVVLDAVGAVPDAVVVPHSLAGLVAPAVAERIGARGIVNLAALTPEPGSSGLKQAKALPGIYTEPYRTTPMTRHDDGSTSVPADIARRLLFHDVDEEPATRAWERLRPQFWAPWVEPCPFETWPDLHYAHVACAGDRVLGAEGMHDGARRTGAPLSWIPGGHLPMLSHPEEAAAAVAAAVAAW